MTNEHTADFTDDPERELDTALRASVNPREATAALTRLLLAFDARRRRREAIAIAETATAASLVARP